MCPAPAREGRAGGLNVHRYEYRFDSDMLAGEVWRGRPVKMVQLVGKSADLENGGEESAHPKLEPTGGGIARTAAAGTRNGSILDDDPPASKQATHP